MFSSYNLKHGFRLRLHAHNADLLQQCQITGKGKAGNRISIIFE
jgi:hypothetical protein